MTMTLREWLDSKPRGALKKMAQETGYMTSSLKRIANCVVTPKLFTARVISTYTNGEVRFDMDKVLCPRYRIARNGKYWNVCYGHKYIASRKTEEAAQALLNEYTKTATKEMK